MKQNVMETSNSLLQKKRQILVRELPSMESQYFVRVDHQQCSLSPSTLFAWKEHYLKELAKRKHGDISEVK